MLVGQDFMPLLGWDHVELWVGNAKQAAYFYERAMGFQPVAYAGPETGVRDRTSYVLEQGEIRLVLTSALRPEHEIARHAHAHGDGVKDVAFAVADATDAYRQALQRGARGVAEPRWVEDEHGRVELASIATYGETLHSFVNREGYEGAYLPGYQALESGNGRPETGVGLQLVDHVVGNVELGRMEDWVEFYERCLAINEPAEGKRKSQIEEYLEFYGGPGVQHIAFATEDIVGTVTALRERGIRFLVTPDAYYEDVGERVGEIDEDWSALRRLKILADRDDEGYLLQIFTKTAQDRPTLFFEMIERHGAVGFGEGNFKALFEAIEREQALRGNL